jgi:uncharacterized membrane protein
MRKKIAIEDASSWILRIGLVLSVSVMLTGIALSFTHNRVPIERMRSATFESDPRLIWRGVIEGRGQAVIELGIYLLVLTPIMRVVTSMILFAFSEKDWLYAAITFLVLLLTLTGLLIFK